MSKYLANYLRKYPLCELQDVFKFIYHDIFGPGHLIKSFDHSYKYLKDECACLEDSIIDEELYDEISSNTLRVNLRPYLKYGYDLNELVVMMIESQSYYHINSNQIVERFYQYKDITIELLDITGEKFEDFVQKIIKSDFKPISHSEKFHQFYVPHYRIVAKEVFLKHIKLS